MLNLNAAQCTFLCCLTINGGAKMKNRVKSLLNSLINQYEQLIDVKFNGDAPDIVNKTAELKLKHHIALLETSIKQLINMGTPIFTFSGRIAHNITENFEIMPNEDEIDGINNHRDRIVFAKFVRAFAADRFAPRFDNFVAENSDAVDSYYKLVEALEIRNKDFKYRTTTLLMCCSDY